MFESDFQFKKGKWPVSKTFHGGSVFKCDYSFFILIAGCKHEVMNRKNIFGSEVQTKRNGFFFCICIYIEVNVFNGEWYSGFPNADCIKSKPLRSWPVCVFYHRYIILENWYRNNNSTYYNKTIFHFVNDSVKIN